MMIPTASKSLTIAELPYSESEHEMTVYDLRRLKNIVDGWLGEHGNGHGQPVDRHLAHYAGLMLLSLYEDAPAPIEEALEDATGEAVNLFVTTKQGYKGIMAFDHFDGQNIIGTHQHHIKAIDVDGNISNPPLSFHGTIADIFAVEILS